MPQPYDTSFVREGRTLVEWLPELVSPKLEVQRRAADVLMAMMHGLPSVHADYGELVGPEPSQEHDDAWKRAVCEAVATPGFPARSFVRTMIDRIIALHDSWMQRYRAPLPEGALSNDDALSMQGIVMGAILDALDAALLNPPGALERLFAHEQLRYQAIRAIERIGPRARKRFEQQLIKLTEADPWSEAIGALASVQRADPALLDRATGWIDEALEDAMADPEAMLTDENAPNFHTQFYEGDRAWNAASMLARIGNTVPANVIAKAMELSRSIRPGHRAAAAMVLGHVARNRDDIDIGAIVDRLLELTRDQSWVAGRAIDALGNLRVDPDRVVPRLIELFDTFEEFDPDECYGGAHARVCRALEQFGAAAAPAVPRLVAALIVEEDEYPQDVIRVLSAIGAPAASALPALQRLRDEMVRRYGDGDSESIQAIERAIKRIRCD